MSHARLLTPLMTRRHGLRARATTAIFPAPPPAPPAAPATRSDGRHATPMSPRPAGMPMPSHAPRISWRCAAERRRDAGRRGVELTSPMLASRRAASPLSARRYGRRRLAPRRRMPAGRRLSAMPACWRRKTPHWRRAGADRPGLPFAAIGRSSSPRHKEAWLPPRKCAPQRASSSDGTRAGRATAAHRYFDGRWPALTALDAGRAPMAREARARRAADVTDARRAARCRFMGISAMPVTRRRAALMMSR